MSCCPRETSPRSFHSPRSIPQVARCREVALRAALPSPRRPGVIHGVTPPGSVPARYLPHVAGGSNQRYLPHGWVSVLPMLPTREPTKHSGTTFLQAKSIALTPEGSKRQEQRVSTDLERIQGG